jgi:hypothetical protein
MTLEVIGRIIDKVPPCKYPHHYYGGRKRCVYCGYEKGTGTLLVREVEGER